MRIKVLGVKILTKSVLGRGSKMESGAKDLASPVYKVLTLILDKDGELARVGSRETW
jgi:hypothetical protein